MWPSWLWVTPLGEEPAVLCPACLAPEAGHVCCWPERILVLSRAKSASCRHIDVNSARTCNSSISMSSSPAQAAAWCAALLMASLTAADSLYCAVQGHDAQ